MNHKRRTSWNTRCYFHTHQFHEYKRECVRRYNHIDLSIFEKQSCRADCPSEIIKEMNNLIPATREYKSIETYSYMEVCWCPMITVYEAIKRNRAGGTLEEINEMCRILHSIISSIYIDMWISKNAQHDQVTTIKHMKICLSQISWYLESSGIPPDETVYAKMPYKAIRAFEEVRRRVPYSVHDYTCTYDLHVTSVRRGVSSKDWHGITPNRKPSDDFTHDEAEILDHFTKMSGAVCSIADHVLSGQEKDAALIQQRLTVAGSSTSYALNISDCIYAFAVSLKVYGLTSIEEVVYCILAIENSCFWSHSEDILLDMMMTTEATAYALAMVRVTLVVEQKWFEQHSEKTDIFPNRPELTLKSNLNPNVNIEYYNAGKTVYNPEDSIEYDFDRLSMFISKCIAHEEVKVINPFYNLSITSDEGLNDRIKEAIRIWLPKFKALDYDGKSMIDAMTVTIRDDSYGKPGIDMAHIKISDRGMEIDVRMTVYPVLAFVTIVFFSIFIWSVININLLASKQIDITGLMSLTLAIDAVVLTVYKARMRDDWLWSEMFSGKMYETEVKKAVEHGLFDGKWQNAVSYLMSNRDEIQGRITKENACLLATEYGNEFSLGRVITNEDLTDEWEMYSTFDGQEAYIVKNENFRSLVSTPGHVRRATWSANKKLHVNDMDSNAISRGILPWRKGHSRCEIG